MSEKIGQWVFDLPECPKDATCAAVDAIGIAYWYTCDPSALKVTDSVAKWYTTRGRYLIIPNRSFDASDWKNSKIIRKEKKMDKMPKLQAGDVIHADDKWYLCISETGCYMLTPRQDTGDVALLYYVEIKRLPQIEGLYRKDDGTAFKVYELYSLAMRGMTMRHGIQVYNNPAVKEMTVDEISKELGYKVKVIGNE